MAVGALRAQRGNDLQVDRHWSPASAPPGRLCHRSQSRLHRGQAPGRDSLRRPRRSTESRERGALVGAVALIALEQRRHESEETPVARRRPRPSRPGIRTTPAQRTPGNPVARTLLDFASVAPLEAVRKAVAKADFQRRIDLEAIDAVTGIGRPGSARLKRALSLHRPEYARTLSPLEAEFLDLCRRHRIPVPEVVSRRSCCGEPSARSWNWTAPPVMAPTHRGRETTIGTSQCARRVTPCRATRGAR
jgi:hypothetical protein